MRERVNRVYIVIILIAIECGIAVKKVAATNEQLIACCSNMKLCILNTLYNKGKYASCS